MMLAVFALTVLWLALNVVALCFYANWQVGQIKALEAQRDRLLERLHPAAQGVLVPIEEQEPRGYGTDEDEYDAWARRERQAGRNPEEAVSENW